MKREDKVKLATEYNELMLQALITKTAIAITIDETEIEELEMELEELEMKADEIKLILECKPKWKGLMKC